MAKAYDKVYWFFLTFVLRSMGFAESFIEMIHRLLSNVWYSVLINGTRFGFFPSSRGLKQGDPLSPSPFVIVDESITKSLNHLHNKGKYIGYSMNNRGPIINHLAYADGVVMFTSTYKYSIKKVMKTLRRYEETSGQEINKDKIFYLASNYIYDSTHNMIQKLTGYRYQSFPFKYLGCPIYSGRKKICYSTDIASNVMNKIGGWQGHVISPGGRATLIKHVLQSQTLHILTSITTPKIIPKQLESYFSNFLWGKSENKNKYHWSSWRNLCYPTDEGGDGFKNLTDLCKTFYTKGWWRFRVAYNLWANFMRAKNTPRSHPVAKVLESKHSVV
nr:uncharacterized protein LOC108944923 [Nicotiana tomentosiformis]XP_018625897.1 uncharacterized protein LOC108944923 [Nicotiana tomentosiformis]